MPGGSTSFLPVIVSKTTRIASRVELVVVPLTVQQARDTPSPLPPNVPNDNPRSPPFAGEIINFQYNVIVLCHRSLV